MPYLRPQRPSLLKPSAPKMKLRLPSKLSSYVLTALLGVALGGFLCYKAFSWAYSDYILLDKAEAAQVMHALEMCLKIPSTKPPAYF